MKQIIIHLFMFGMVFAMFSCKSIKMVQSNPTPSLKGLHMWDEHRGYTKEQFLAHPDHNCNLKQ